jgi:hypothetical protein
MELGVNVPFFPHRPTEPASKPAPVSVLLRRPVRPEAPAPAPTEPPETGPAKIPPRWAAGLAAVVLVLAAVLVGTGTSAGVVLEVLGGGGFIATEIVRRLNGGN